ncbi:MAG: GMC family oxidoreductase, partial [Nitrospirota bacterium]|nr:GMC family oxidoreductase [Nitrospirota bacterium]
FVRGYSMFTQATLGPVWFAKGGSTRKPLPWGEAHKEYMKNNFAHNVSLVILGEDLPSEENRVTLDPGVVDSNGIPAPKITYKMKENTLNLMNHGLARAEDILWAAGAYEVKKIGIMPIALHLMGTARMGNDASRSVVNSWCQAHDVDNLFIADGSCFVTSGAVNPTHTIQAIALRCAEYIVDTF